VTDKIITAGAVVAVGLVPTGIALGLYYDQQAWFLMSVLAAVVLAAG